MANKRNLKKQVRYICGDLAGECIMARDFIEGIDADKMNDVILRIAGLQVNSLKNASFSFDKTPKSYASLKEYHKAAHTYYNEAYKTFYAEFNKQVEEIVKAMNALLPKAQREINKTIASLD
ncbi:MAG: hypothetical protein K2M94_00050 [Paramuribaculum sp.]|nr:hypothetical protein [Paramuribaculum sp.]